MKTYNLYPNENKQHNSLFQNKKIQTTQFFEKSALSTVLVLSGGNFF